MSDFDRMDGGRRLGCGGIIVTTVLVLGIPTMIYGFVCWLAHWMEIYQP